MTVGLTLTLCLMAYQGKVPSEAFVGIASVVVTHYFNKVRSGEK